MSHVIVERITRPYNILVTMAYIMTMTYIMDYVMLNFARQQLTAAQIEEVTPLLKEEEVILHWQIS